jgi:hypothetical protein
LLAFGAQPVCQQREIDLAGASPTFLGPVRRAKEVVLAKTA